MSIVNRNVESKENVVFSICQFRSGNTFNVYPDSAELGGSIRYFDKAARDLVKERIKTISECTAAAHLCTAEVKLEEEYPPVINHKMQTENVIRLAKKHFGEGNFSQDGLPLMAAEDFSFFLENKPGCFFTLGTMKMGQQLMTLHTSNYDYNDNLIPTCAYLYMKIIEDRMGVEILQE